MRSTVRAGLIGLCAFSLIGTGVLMLLWTPDRAARRAAEARTTPSATGARTPQSGPASASAVPLFSDGFADDGGYELSLAFLTPPARLDSLGQVRDETRARPQRGIAAIKSQIDRLPALDAQRSELEMMVGLLHMYQGNYEQAIGRFNASAENPRLHPLVRANLIALRGVASLRRGEVENCVACVGPSSCLFPIADEATHKRPEGSRAAVRDFTAYLQERPDDLGVRWLLNIAYMTLGEYPEKVPAEYLIPLDSFRSAHDPGKFTNVSLLVGLDRRQQNMLGGSIFDDFTGDGLPDIFIGSLDADLAASLFVSRGDGSFEDRGEPLGLADQFLSLNARQADFDNDGRLDILMLRGGWEYPCRLSLLRNAGDRFEDVTVGSGLGEPIATETAAWGDYDNDGLLDLYVGGETRPNGFESLNRCRLYHNEGHGRFVDVAKQAGVENARWTKGVAWGDYDDDGLIDLYVANRGSASRLYRNNGDGTFADVAESLGVTGPLNAFSCWLWDYDNDGRLDIFVAAFNASLNDFANDVLGLPSKGERPRLYRNLGPEGFRDVTKEAGLDRVWMTMGSNFADIDNDGFLDMYLGTGLTSYSALVPNVMLKNVDGVSFTDVTVATGTGHLQKGHGVSFADWDGDGDLDLFVETGGSVPGDRAYNSLFQNPGNRRHWLSLKLVGTRSNKSAIGAQVRAEFVGTDGKRRAIRRVVGSGSSFGGNSLTVHFGLDTALKVEALTLTWPGVKSAQTFRDVDVDQALEITQGAETYKKLPPHRLTVPAASP